jgi:chloramphenicol 3-O-phosphotransferase
MHLLFLHGPPASGKLTIARELAAFTGYPLFHNHLVVDAALAVYPFGTPGFIALRDRLWRAVFDQFRADPQLPRLIFTFNPESSVPQKFIDDLFAQFSTAPHHLHSIALTCPEAEIERRLNAPSRHEHRKLTDAALYRSLRDQGVFNQPHIPRTDLSIDTALVSPADTARQITRRLRHS